MHLKANAIGCEKSSCLLLFMARGAGDGFLKLTYMLIEAIKKVGRGLGLYPPFEV